ncbi:MAG: hypothetical protein ACLTDS_05860 [Bianqueaceae bacterium]
MKIERLLTAAEESGDLEVYSEEIKEATNMVSDGVSKSLSQLLNIQNTVVTKFLDFALGLLWPLGSLWIEADPYRYEGSG